MTQHTFRWHWIALLTVAVLLRLAALNAVPLAPDETLLALPAWDAIHGAGWPASATSAFLLVGNAFLFMLLGAGDGIARLWPALAGSALVALPWFWRRRLGETGALVAAGLLALSPAALFASRRLDGAIIGALGGALVLTALFREIRENPRPISAVLLAAGIALGLTGGPSFYDTLLPGLLAWAAYRWITGEASRHGRHVILGEVPEFTTDYTDCTEKKDQKISEIREICGYKDLEHCSPPTRSCASRHDELPLLAGLAGALLISTGLGFRWNGWAGPGDGLRAWFAGWRAAGALASPVTLLLLYEPLAVFLALVGLLIAWRRNHKGQGRRSLALPLTLGLWALLAGLLLLLRRGASPTALLAPLVPLTLLGGWSVQQLAQRALPWGWQEWLHALLSLVFWAFAGLALARHTSHLSNGTELLLIVLVFLTQGFLTAGFVTFVGERRAWRGLFGGIAITLLLIQVSFAGGLAYLRPASPAEPLVTRAASPDLRNLRRTIEDLRAAQNQPAETFDVVLVAGEPGLTAAVRWALRDVLALRLSSDWPETPPHLVIASTELTSPGTATGASFTAALRAGGPLPGCAALFPPSCEQLVDWYLYRHTAIPPRQERVILWAESRR